MDKKGKMVVVWGGESILCASIHLLLTSRQDWTVISVADMREFESLVLSRENEFLDLVIIQPGDLPEPCNIPLQLLSDHSGIKVITITLADNTLDIYNKQEILITDVSDLVSVIEASA